MIDSYGWRGGREALLRFGPLTSAGGAPVVVAAMPPLAEASYVRAFMITLLRALAGHGIRSALPDLPGSGESLVDVETVTLEDWREAFAAAVDHAAPGGGAATIAIRAGALLDRTAAVANRWQFAPVTGSTLLRELYRTRIAGDREDGRATTQAMLDAEAAAAGLDLAGHHLSAAMIASLRTAEPPPARVVRLAADAQPADLKVAGAPLWRRAEPGNDSALAERLAADIAAWLA